VIFVFFIFFFDNINFPLFYFFSFFSFYNTVTEEVGKLEGNTRDTDSRAKALAARNTALNFDRIKSDLNQVRKENKDLSKQLKGTK